MIFPRVQVKKVLNHTTVLCDVCFCVFPNSMLIVCCFSHKNRGWYNIWHSNHVTTVKGIQHLSTSNVIGIHTLSPNFGHAQIRTKQAPFHSKPISLFPKNSSMHTTSTYVKLENTLSYSLNTHPHLVLGHTESGQIQP